MANELKAGTVDDLASSLASYIDTAMKNEWQAVKGEPLPGDDQGAKDRQILFAAISQGVLKFLADHLADLVTSDDSGDAGVTTHHHTMNFSVDAVAMNNMPNGRHLAFPFHIGTDGRTATPVDLSDHIRGEIIQLLLTAPGERPFVPSFGAGLRRLVFHQNDDATAGITKALVSQNLSRWLGHRVKVEALDVSAEDSTLNVDLRYRVIATGEVKQVRFQRQGAK